MNVYRMLGRWGVGKKHNGKEPRKRQTAAATLSGVGLNLTTIARYASFASLPMAQAPSPIIRARAEMGYCWQAQQGEQKSTAFAVLFLGS